MDRFWQSLLPLIMLLSAGRVLGQPPTDGREQPVPLTVQPVAFGEPFDGELAYRVLEEVCRLGPRVSGTPAMEQQREMLKEYIAACGGTVVEHSFETLHPETRQTVRMVNLFGRWHPERRKRLLFCCHYDTRPFPDRDQQNPHGVFLGANDGASGVGLLSALFRHFAALEGKWGIDVAFFDGEELVYVPQRDPLFVGSTVFSEHYARGGWDVRYDFAILVDMIGDRHLEIFQEKNSMKMAPRLTKSIWSVAADLGVSEFIPRQKHEIRDDHLPLNTIARIQSCDIIDFDYPTEEQPNLYWHTTRDVPENCSAESLEKVGRVLLEWLVRLQQIRSDG